MRASKYLALAILLAGASADAAPGDWNIYMDSSGINRITAIGDSLWCGSRGGILLYDLGNSTFTLFLDGLDLRSSDITSVTVDGRGSIWAGMRASGAVRIDDPGGADRVKHYSEVIDGILSDSITCLLRVEEDIYYGCMKGAAKFFNNTPTYEPGLTDSLMEKTVYDLAWDSGRRLLWAACEGGIASFDRGTFELVFYPIGTVLSVCTHGGDVFCTAGPEIRNLGDGSWPVFGPSFAMAPVSVASGGGRLYCQTPERVYLWDGSYWVHQATTELKNLFLEEYRIGWSRNILGALAVDGEGTPWTGGYFELGARGVYINALSGGIWTNHTPGGLSQNEIVAIDCDAAGNVWVSTSRFGISYRSTEDEWISYTKIRSDVGSDDALSYYINNLALVRDRWGYLWCNALDFDLDRIDLGDPLDKSDDVWTHFSPGAGTILSNRFVKADEDPEGNRWFMSDDVRFTEGMWGINIAGPLEGDWYTVDPNSHPQMQGGSIFGCAFSETGVYIAMRGYGVMYWNTGGFDWPTLTSTAGDYWVTVLDEDQLPSNELWDIERASDGSVWVGTSGGLVRYYQGTVDSFKVKTRYNEEGLIGGTIYDIEFDGAGNLWIATNRGLNRMSIDGVVLDAYTTAQKWLEELQLVYPPDVISPLPNHDCRVLEYDRSGGYIWIGTENGLARFDANEPVEVILPMSEMFLYPNPVHIGSGSVSLRIGRISGSVDINVFSLEGDLVHEAHGIREGDVAWDLLTLNGYRATSGIYVVRVSGEGGSAMRKVAVIK